jgi:hypothetical protein
LTRFAKTVEAHRHGVPHGHGGPHGFRTKISIGLLEGLSSLVQAPKARTRSFRLIRTLVAMTYLLHGKLSDLQPVQSSEEPQKATPDAQILHCPAVSYGFWDGNSLTTP